MIPTITLEFDIQYEEPLIFNGFSGVALRAALYESLSLLYLGHDATSTQSRKKTDPILYLMEQTSSVNTTGESIVRPFALRPPLEISDNELTFGVSLVGEARQLLPYILSGVEAMGVLGLGINRSKFALKSVRYANQTTDHADIMNSKTQINSEKSKSLHSSNNAQDLVSPSLNIKFLTPTTIILNRQLCLIPQFNTWFHRLLERILQLKSTTTDDASWIPVNKLLEQADKIEILNDYTVTYGMQRSNRYSRSIIGYIGEVIYTGDFADLLPYIFLGQYLHVGKNIVKGCGWYAIN
jgi:hypothetical protein